MRSLRLPVAWRAGGPEAASSISTRSVPATERLLKKKRGLAPEGQEHRNDQNVKIMPTAKPSPLMLVAVVSSTLPYSA